MNLKRTLTSISVATVAAGMLSACGGVNPGIAVEVNGATLSNVEFDERVDAVCAYLIAGAANQPEAAAPPPRATVGELVSAAFVVDQLKDQIQDTFQVQPSEGLQQGMKQFDEQRPPGLTDDEQATVRTVYAASVLGTDLALGLGNSALAAQGQPATDQNQALQLGYEQLTDFATKQSIEFAPSLGSLTFEPGSATTARNDTSYAVSGLAVAQADPAALPTSQRCGG